MKWLNRIRGAFAPKPDPVDAKLDTAIRIADEVTAQIRERAKAPSPFRAALADMLLGVQPADPVLIADAYEMAQEALIYRGPPNGKG